MTRDDKILAEVISQFKYKSDGKIDKWRFTLRGDCEDFALSLLARLVGGKSEARKALLSGAAAMWRVETLSGEAHAVLEWKGRFADNRHTRWKSSLDEMGLKPKPRKRYSQAMLALKLGFGAIFGGLL